MNLYHYYEKGNIPFLTLSDLSIEEANMMQDKLKEKDNVYTKRDYDGKYMHFRTIVENNIRSAFIKKGGKPTRKSPIYCILGESHEKNNTIYKEWFKTPDFIEMPMYESMADVVSFTYGDSFVENHPEHRDQTKYYETVCTYEEILQIISNKGWPQNSVTDDSPFWVPRYIEAQIWSDEVINKYRTN